MWVNMAHGARQRREGLSNLEAWIMAEVASGTTDNEVARKLLIYPHAVKRHLRSILQKLGARDRVQAIDLWKAMHGPR
jgi:DNA-binding NarL/FixJ family response regulator